MGKKRKTSHFGGKPTPSPSSKAKNQASNNSDSSNKQLKNIKDNAKNKQRSSSSEQHRQPTIPFDPEEHHILLVGEGDLSFAASLADHHNCLYLTATVFDDSPEALAAKYPHAADNAELVEAADGRVLYGVDATTMGPWCRKTNEGNSKERVGTMDRILFNFPHVGGKSTDVNRQVRYNQELLVAFFRRALLSLAPGGAIVVTLFEGDPYTLWNIRDLGRHAGLQVERSFRFQFSAYPGYHHARTLGVVRKRAGTGAGTGAAELGESETDKASEAGETAAGFSAEEAVGAWKGEDRAARSYVFVRKDEVPPPPPPQSKNTKTKRKRAGNDDSDADDSD